MNQELYNRLISAGLEEAEATDIAKSNLGASTQPDSVDIDRLTKALGDVKETFEKGDLPETNEVDLVEQDITASAEGSSDDSVIDAITKGADAILAQNREHISAREVAQDGILERLDVLAKGFTALVEEFQVVKGALATSDENIAKSLHAVREDLNTPNAPRATLSKSQVIPAPGDVSNNVITRSEAISKALSEMQAVETADDRRKDLGRAVTLLEAGGNLETTVRQYGLQN